MGRGDLYSRQRENENQEVVDAWVNEVGEVRVGSGGLGTEVMIVEEGV